MKKMLLPLLGIILLAGCEKEAATPITQDADSTLGLRSVKRTVCHYTGSETNPYEIIEVADQSWINAHQEHGDAVDMDGDGFFDRANECNPEIDCDDDNPAVNPAAEEICGDGVDNNCDGQIDEDCAPGLAIGDLHAGGIIFYLDGNGGGLVAATTDQVSAPWGCSGTSISGASGTAVGTGRQNTTAILNGCNVQGIAARICDAYSVTVDGVTYHDWFLPSIDELNLMYVNLHSANIGGFVNVQYWSSTEYDASMARVQYFSAGDEFGPNKSSSYRVRAVRAF